MNKNDYIFQNLITYIGNKRKLLTYIEQEIISIKIILTQPTLSTFDGFMGSGVISRMFKYHSHLLIGNDLENYSYIINQCYLAQPSTSDIQKIHACIDELNTMEYTTSGIITGNYSPKNTYDIKDGERAFYTHENAIIIDSIRYSINNYDDVYKCYLLAPLLTKASIHTNTSGVFKGFHKKDGIGHFGGKNEDNTESRITKKIILDKPLFSTQEHKCDVTLYNTDINEILTKLPMVDVAYLDPPYNQHPYGSNYFMLNTILHNTFDSENISKVSGIPNNWNKSEYNYKKSAYTSIFHLIKEVRAKYIILSYNNEGILSMDEIKNIISECNYNYTLKTIEYNTYRGSKNLHNRSLKVQEYLWIIETHKQT